MPVWEQRFRAPTVSLPDWSPHAADRLTFESTESGVWQVHAWDAATGDRRQVTDHPVGVITGTPTLDGEQVLYWQDETGDESGRWFAQPFHGGDARPFLEGVPVGWNEGFAQAPGVVAAAVSDRDGFAIYVAADGGPAKETARSTEFMTVAGPRGWVQPRRPVGGRDAAVPVAQRARRPDAPGAARGGPAHGRGRGRDDGRGQSAGCLRVVAGARRSAVGGLARAHRRAGARDLGPGRGLVDGPRHEPRRAGRGAGLVARRHGAAGAPGVRGTPSPLQAGPGDRRAEPRDAPAGTGRRAHVSGPTAASGSVTRAAPSPPVSWTTPARRCWWPRARGRRWAGRTSRGTSPTRAGRPCTASTSRRPVRARSRS